MSELPRSVRDDIRRQQHRQEQEQNSIINARRKKHQRESGLPAGATSIDGLKTESPESVREQPGPFTTPVAPAIEEQELFSA